MYEKQASRIELVRGDITKLSVGAIVNAANTTLLGGGGVDGAIHRAAGPELLEECRRLGGCPTGEARITRGCRLPARHVIHAVGPVYRDGKHGEPEMLRSAYESSLRLARDRGIESVAFPAISTGAYGYPKAEAAEVALRTALEWLAKEALPERIIFCLFDAESLAIYERTLSRLAGSPGEGPGGPKGGGPSGPGGRGLSAGLALLALLASGLAGASAAAGEAPARPPLWLAVAPPSLAPAVEALAERRSHEGLEAAIVPPGGSDDPVSEAIRARARRPGCITLVGDFEEGASAEPWCLPPRRVEGVYWRGGGRREFWSDSAYGDFDGDRVPDVPVGRIPARTPAEVSLVVRKIIAFEDRAPRIEDLDLPFWAGDPAFGPAAQAFAPLVALEVVRRELPPWVSPWVMVADPEHPLCGWPPDQPELFSARLKKGASLGAVMSHGFVRGVRGMPHEGRVTAYRVEDAERAFGEGPPAPPVFVITCSSGDFTAPARCLTEAFLFSPGGPVAAAGATEESHPLPNAYLGIALARTLGRRPRTVGELWLEAQRTALAERNVIFEFALSRAAGALGMETDVEGLKRDQPLIYALLGDPATRLKRPEPLRVAIAREGDRWRYRVEPPDGAREIHVGVRGPAELEPRAPLAGPEEARRRLAEGNAALGYRPVRAEAHPRSWEGVLERPGIYRFAVVAPDTVRVAVEEVAQSGN